MTTDASKLKKIAADLLTLHNEYEAKLQPAFIASLNQQKAVQKSEDFCEKQVKHFMHNIQPLRARLNSLKSKELVGADSEAINEVQNGLEELSTAILLIKRNLPAPAGKYLYLVLGSVRVSMPSKMKLLYKIEYENFKLAVTWALLLLSLVCLFRGAGTRWDPVLMFGLVWFYCTLTIRESILKANGSNISGWWRIYHFLATGLSGVIVLWADKPGFQNHLRTCFLAYTFVVLVAHQVQYRYQAGTLYRLQALGNTANEGGSPMEISVEGVRSSVAQPMLRDFFILMPFLYAVYLIQLLMVYLIVEQITSDPDAVTWHAGTAAVFFGVMFVGNVFNTSMAIYSKCTSKFPDPLYLVRKFQ
ncbi:transmembrane protein 120B [Galendromus occidentalis]|uniref:Transmembrane protein 120B n=1 Tax=Galendromus occidentalis TaxID=34638 RepID=A0AAJ6VWC7_9ACAR|nr:transmembrane protein 120B [Galendromus occidentalis]